MTNSKKQIFTLRVKKQYDDTYTFEVTQSGWMFRGSGPANVDECDEYGEPHFFRALRDNNFTYPSDLGHLLCILHEHAIYKTMDEEEIQKYFNELSNYLHAVDAIKVPDIEPYIG